MKLKPEWVNKQAPSKAQAFARPFLLDDMDIFLQSLKEYEVRLLKYGGLPLVHYARVTRQLIALPEPMPPNGFDRQARACSAWWMIGLLELVSVIGSRLSPRYSVNGKGEEWLKLSREKKLTLVLSLAPCGLGKNSVEDQDDLLSWFSEFESLPFPPGAKTLRVLLAMNSAMASLEREAPYETWLTHATALENPFLADKQADINLSDEWERWHHTPEVAYAKILQYYLGRLSSLGAVELSHDAEGNLAMTLSSIGLWLFDKSETWTWPKDIRPIAIISADFTIALLEGNPILAHELGAFTEFKEEEARTCTQFLLTRLSVQRGLHAGLNATEMLRILGACSKTGLPQNVVHEIEAWCAAKSNLRIREGIMVEGENALETAEVFSRFPKEFLMLTPTLLEYIGVGNRAALEKKLFAKGFFSE